MVSKILEIIQLGNIHKYYAEKEEYLHENDSENEKCNWDEVNITPEIYPELADAGNTKWLSRYGPNYSELQSAYAEEITVLMKHWLETDPTQTVPITDEYLATIKSK